MNDYVLGQARYIGSFKELPEIAEEYDVVIVGSTLYLWYENKWQEIINYEENLLSRMITKIRKARNSKLKKELEELIEEEYGQFI